MLFLHDFINCIYQSAAKTSFLQRADPLDRSPSRRAYRVLEFARMLAAPEHVCRCAEQHLGNDAVCLTSCHTMLDQPVRERLDENIRECRRASRAGAAE